MDTTVMPAIIEQACGSGLPNPRSGFERSTPDFSAGAESLPDREYRPLEQPGDLVSHLMGQCRLSIGKRQTNSLGTGANAVAVDLPTSYLPPR